MKPSNTLSCLLDGITLTGDVRVDTLNFLSLHGCPRTAAHVEAVASTAMALARRFDVDPHRAVQAGYLHDISAVIPNAQRVDLARQLGISPYPEEVQLPMILHQRLSAIFAEQLFDISDTAILNAIGCHTTLKAGASTLDKVVFVADKISWDQPGIPPWRDALSAGLDVSLDAGTCAYLRYLWSQRDSLAVVHPWFKQACLDLYVMPHEAPASKQ